MADWHRFCILANAELGRAFARYSRRSSSLAENWYIVAIFVAIPLLWLALAYWDKFRRRMAERGGTPKALFLELCAAHRLSRDDRALLWQAAQSRGLNHPAIVFTDPAILGELAADGGSRRSDYARLHKQLFGAAAA